MFYSSRMKSYVRCVRFKVITMGNVKITVFGVVVPCTLVEVTDVSDVAAASVVRV